MIISFYKEYFEIELRHASAPGEICTSFSLAPCIRCQTGFQSYRMSFKKSPGEAMIFYSGAETADHSHVLAPAPEIPDGTEFLFIVSADDKSILNRIKIPAEPDVHVEDLEKVIPWQFIRPAIFSFSFDQTASTKSYEQFTVESESGETVYQSIIKKDKEIDGIYACSVDMSFSDPGIYTFKLGTGEKKFYIDTISEMAGNYGFIRFKKNAGWLKPVNLNFGIPVDYNRFVYTFDPPS